MNTKLALAKARTAVAVKKVAGKINYMIASALAFVGVAAVYADDLDATETLRSTLNLVFSLMQFGGFLLTAYGVVIIAKAIASPDSSDPHGITKGVGAIVGGVIMLAMKSILNVVGVDVGNFTISTS